MWSVCYDIGYHTIITSHITHHKYLVPVTDGVPAYERCLRYVVYAVTHCMHAAWLSAVCAALGLGAGRRTGLAHLYIYQT